MSKNTHKKIIDCKKCVYSELKNTHTYCRLRKISENVYVSSAIPCVCECDFYKEKK